MAAAAVLTAGTSATAAPDLDAGKAQAQAVCAACHGANGVSVSDGIPNLAGQRAAYLENQLKAWKDGSRKNAVMNAVAAQLSAGDMANLAAHFAAQPGAQGGVKSDFMPAMLKARINFPADYQASFTRYHVIDAPDAKTISAFWASPAALKAAREGKAMPDGAVILVEVSSVKMGADQKPQRGADGRLVADQVVSYSAMAREAGWGKEFPALLRNEDWNYALFNGKREARTNVNQAVCLACHKPQDKSSYLFTLAQMQAASR
jgi:cytochrome c553